MAKSVYRRPDEKGVCFISLCPKAAISRISGSRPTSVRATVTNPSWKRAPHQERLSKGGKDALHGAKSPKGGTTREQLVEHLTRRLDPATWDLIRHGVLSNVLYKVGDEPGFFAVLNATSVDEAIKIVAEGMERLELFDPEVVPVNQFPHFV